MVLSYQPTAGSKKHRELNNPSPGQAMNFFKSTEENGFALLPDDTLLYFILSIGNPNYKLIRHWQRRAFPPIQGVPENDGDCID